MIMGISIGGKYPCKATVWDMTAYEKYTDIKLSTGKKNQQGNWETDFSSKCRFIGKAHKKAATLRVKDKITPTNIEVAYKWNSEKGQAYFQLLVYDFEVAEKNPDAVPTVPSTDADGFMSIPDNLNDEGLPF